jgi:hypothetical protein
MVPIMDNSTETCSVCGLLYKADSTLQPAFLVELAPAITAGRRTIYADTDRIVHQCPEGSYGSCDLIA